MLATSDYVILTPPAPKVVSILKKSEFGTQDNEIIRENLVNSLNKLTFSCIISVIIIFNFEINEKYYCLYNLDRKNDIIWVSIENDKYGRVPKG